MAKESDDGMYPLWYAVMTAPRMEFVAEQNLRRQGYWTWLPHHRVKDKRKLPNRDAYKIEVVNEAYFPRYLFVALRRETDSMYAINETDGVSTVVYQGEEPLPIPHDIMDELMARADLDGLVGQIDKTARKRFKRGQRVTFVDESPFAGFMGMVQQDTRASVRVLLEIFGKDRPISVAPNTVKAAE